jgi:hypothetical protein
MKNKFFMSRDRSLVTVTRFSHYSSAVLMSLRPGFRNRFTFNPFCSNRTNNFNSVSPNGLARKIYKTKFPTLQLQSLSAPLCRHPFSISRITFTFSSTLSTLCW